MTVYTRTAVTALLIFVAAPAYAEDRGPKTTSMVKVEGTTFRVVIQRDTAKVDSKGSAFWAHVDAFYFKRAQKAVEIASGCKVVETNAYRAMMWATLDCSKSADSGAVAN